MHFLLFLVTQVFEVEVFQDLGGGGAVIRFVDQHLGYNVLSFC